MTTSTNATTVRSSRFMLAAAIALALIPTTAVVGSSDAHARTHHTESTHRSSEKSNHQGAKKHARYERNHERGHHHRRHWSR